MMRVRLLIPYRPDGTDGTYTARCVAWSGSCGTGWLDSHDDNFTVEAKTASAGITSVSVSPDQVVAGSSITVSYTVRNTGNYSRSFNIGGEIRLGSTVMADLNCQTTSTIQPGSYDAGSFTYTIPSGWTDGTYTARCVAWSGSCGTGWLDYREDDFIIEAVETDADIISVSVSPNPVSAGNTITATITLQNTGGQSWTYYVGASSILDDGTVWE